MSRQVCAGLVGLNLTTRRCGFTGGHSLRSTLHIARVVGKSGSNGRSKVRLAETIACESLWASTSYGVGDLWLLNGSAFLAYLAG